MASLRQCSIGLFFHLAKFLRGIDQNNAAFGVGLLGNVPIGRMPIILLARR